MKPVRVVGVDPGTMSMDILGLLDEGSRVKVFYERVIPRDEVTKKPRIVVEAVEEAAARAGGLDAVVAPSGYGMPLKRAQEASVEDILEATFVTREDVERRLRIIGLREVMMAFRESSLPAWFTPGVIHLPTVPEWRKANRIDMGTADKVYTVAAALANLYDAGVKPHDVDAIVVEIGYAYTAAMAVESGAIVDGVGGTTGYTGYLGMGFMDAELAYAMAAVEPRFSKTRLFQGGAAYIAGHSNPSDLEGFAEKATRGDPRYTTALNAMIEAVLKDIAVLLVSVPKPRWIMLSGRWLRIQKIRDRLLEALRNFLTKLSQNPKIRVIETPLGHAKQAAYGAAVMADGLAGGRYTPIIETLRLKDSKGSIFDHIHLPNLREKLLQEFRNIKPATHQDPKQDHTR